MSFPRYPKYNVSGVEWLRQVPEHWMVVPFKAIIAVTITEVHTKVLGTLLLVPWLRNVSARIR